MPQAAICGKKGINSEMLRLSSGTSWVTLTRELQWGGGDLGLMRVSAGVKVMERQTNQFEGCCYTKEERDGATGLAG